MEKNNSPKQTFIKIGKLRDYILKMFDDIDNNISNKIYIDNLSKAIEIFIKLVENIADIHIYDNIFFTILDNDKKVNRPFSKKELENLYDLWSEDCISFELQFKMLIYEYKLSKKLFSISKAYNIQAKKNIMTPELLDIIFKTMIFGYGKNEETFLTYEGFLKRLIHSAVPNLTIKRTIDTIITDFEPSTVYTQKVKNKVKTELNLNDPIFESKSQYGFYNPFDNEDDIIDVKVQTEDGKIKNKSKEEKDSFIKNIKIWDTNKIGKIYYKNNKMYAGKIFYPNDIIEECPVKELSSSDLYSKSIRDIAFDLDKKNNLYGLPLGYANCYRNSLDSNIDGNINYDYDFNKKIIYFYAIKKINKNEELIINANEDNFINELKPYQFDYSNSINSLYNSKIKPIVK